ncbi:MAG: hypothetical protein KAW67_00395, partial [Candidatus Eisenbacteria sp.]|nr:hypothetical protein [Candidatus Eisenbacteria bacterium]
MSRRLTNRSSAQRVAPSAPAVPPCAAFPLTAARLAAVPAAVLLTILLLTLGGCSILGPSGAGFRTFAMGFTPFPHAATDDAVIQAWNIIASDGDMAVVHLDGGIPWQEALDGTPYPSGFSDMIEFCAGRIPLGHTVYVAVTPISNTRDGLAGYRDDLGVNQPLPPPWDGYDFDSPDVITAFTAFCEDMIEAFSPDYFAYAIEANMVNELAPSQWDEFLHLAANTYSSLKTNHPALPVLATLQVESYYRDTWEQEEAISQLVPYTDVMALSTYPFGKPLSDPTALEDDYFSTVSDIAPGLPFAIAETAWPAEDIDAPYPITIAADDSTQQAYVERVLAECEFRDAAFLCW